MSWSTVRPEHKDLARQVLTARQLRVLELRINGHSWTAIAYYTGTTTSTARAHFNAALRRLKPHITG